MSSGDFPKAFEVVQSVFSGLTGDGHLPVIGCEILPGLSKGHAIPGILLGKNRLKHHKHASSL